MSGATAMERLPVSVITGFLGSGKTTLLGRLLKDPDLTDTAVIVNEFGEVGLDHLLVEAPRDETVLLNNGCLCCTILGDLVDTLGDLMLRRDRGAVPPFKRVVVETTGLADPAPILHTVMTDPAISTRYYLDSVVTVVDGVNGGGQLDRHFESVKQAAVADRIVISKTDLADTGTVESLRRRLGAFNTGAELIEAVKGDVSARRLLGIGFATPEATGPRVERWLGTAASGAVAAPEDCAVGHSHDHAGHHEHRHEPGDFAHQDSIRTFCLTYDRPIHPEGLKLWLDQLGAFRGPNLLRVKGLLNVNGDPVVIQAMQHLFHEPMVLRAWPTEDRNSRIVFITSGIERSDVERTLAAFGFKPRPGRTAAPSPQNYAQFLDIVQRFQSRD